MGEKRLLDVYSARSQHMVGDGFPVRNLFPSHDLTEEISPFLLLDYAGPAEFGPTDRPRGVGEHPHRGGIVPHCLPGKSRPAGLSLKNRSRRCVEGESGFLSCVRRTA